MRRSSPATGRRVYSKTRDAPPHAPPPRTTVDMSSSVPSSSSSSAFLHDSLWEIILSHLDGEDLAAMACTSARFRALAADDGAWRRLCERDDLFARQHPDEDPNRLPDAPGHFGSWKRLYAYATTDRRARRNDARESEYYRARNRWLVAYVELEDAVVEEKRLREERRRIVADTTGRVERMLAGSVPDPAPAASFGRVPRRDGDGDGPEERAIRTGRDALRALDVHLTTVVRKIARVREEEKTTRDVANELLRRIRADEARKRAWRVSFRPVDPDCVLPEEREGARADADEGY